MKLQISVFSVYHFSLSIVSITHSMSQNSCGIFIVKFIVKLFLISIDVMQYVSIVQYIYLRVHLSTYLRVHLSRTYRIIALISYSWIQTHVLIFEKKECSLLVIKQRNIFLITKIITFTRVYHYNKKRWIFF